MKVANEREGRAYIAFGHMIPVKHKCDRQTCWGSPVAPVKVVAPVKPVSPVEPVALVKPVAPVQSVAPVHESGVSGEISEARCYGDTGVSREIGGSSDAGVSNETGGSGKTCIDNKHVSKLQHSLC